MNCLDAKSLLDPYADGELDASKSIEVEQHLHTCADCARVVQNRRVLRASLRQFSAYYEAPSGFKSALKSELRRIAGIKPWWRSWNWPALTTASSALAAACAIALTLVLLRPAPSPLDQEIVASHIRSLMANHMLDVVSTDQHTVKPWFNGKLDFAPPVKDLAAQDFPLMGGRLDYLDGHTVAALIFRRNKHLINLFIWPATDSDSQPAPIFTTQGYHLIRWNSSGMTLYAISDLNENELLEFANAYNRP